MGEITFDTDVITFRDGLTYVKKCGNICYISFMFQLVTALTSSIENVKIGTIPSEFCSSTPIQTILTRNAAYQTTFTDSGVGRITADGRILIVGAQNTYDLWLTATWFSKS